MRQLFVVIVLFAGAFSYSIKPQIKSGANVQPYIFEDLINSTIESVRPDIPDPLLIEDLDVSVPDEEDAVLTGNVSLNNLNLTGLQGFQITALNFDLVGLRLNFTLVFPDINLYTDYDLNVTLESNLNVFGAGNLSVQLEDVTIRASGQANLTGGISIENLLVDATLGDATFDIHGLFNDEDLSAEITEFLNESAVELIDDNQELVTQIISPIIQDVVNAILANVLGDSRSHPINLLNKLKRLHL